MDNNVKVIHPDRSMDYNHIVGNLNCIEGWCGSEYPKKCKCGGLIHADFGDETYDGYWLYTECDLCGESSKD